MWVAVDLKTPGGFTPETVPEGSFIRYAETWPDNVEPGDENPRFAPGGEYAAAGRPRAAHREDAVRNYRTDSREWYGGGRGPGDTATRVMKWFTFEYFNSRSVSGRPLTAEAALVAVGWPDFSELVPLHGYEGLSGVSAEARVRMLTAAATASYGCFVDPRGPSGLPGPVYYPERLPLAYGTVHNTPARGNMYGSGLCTFAKFLAVGVPYSARADNGAQRGWGHRREFTDLCTELLVWKPVNQS